MQPVHIPARDGENLLCYLSRPPHNTTTNHSTTTTTSSLPLVLLIHGGPQHRDYWGFHPLCQLLCNRGINVLQVNYRGSTGLGTRFLKLGFSSGAFAHGVQNDIDDAAHYALQQGWCSSSRHLAIMGASFGGYHALAGITYRTTNTTTINYRCAVALCPPSVCGAAQTKAGFYGNPLSARYWRRVYGQDVADNLDASKKISPLFHTDRIACPLFLAHGDHDPRVPVSQTNDLWERLSRRRSSSHHDCEYVRFADEGHGIQKEQNVLFLYHCIERFLCRHLDLPDPPALDKSWIKGHTGNLMIQGDADDRKRTDLSSRKNKDM